MAILRIVVLVGKVLAVILFFMMVRWSWPRFRFDQLMALAWKVMLPLGMVNLVADRGDCRNIGAERLLMPVHRELGRVDRRLALSPA